VYFQQGHFLFQYIVFVAEALRENEMQTNTNCTSQTGFNHFQISTIALHSK